MRIIGLVLFIAAVFQVGAGVIAAGDPEGRGGGLMLKLWGGAIISTIVGIWLIVHG